MAQSVLLVGHSYVPRLVRFMRETNRDNFEFKAARTECNYSGRGGATIAKLVANGVFAKLANIAHTWLLSTLERMT